MYPLLSVYSILLVMKNVVQPFNKFQNSKAIELRKSGLSYSEIQKKLHLPKSTLSLWLRNVELSESQKKRLIDKRSDKAKSNIRKRILKNSELIEEIKTTSSKSIGEISKRELWLMGIILYWRERVSSGNESDIKNGVRFTSSDSNLIKLFLKWLQGIGGIKNDEIVFDIFIGEDKKSSVEAVKEVILYWSKITGFSKEHFLNHIYFQRNLPKRRLQPGHKKRHRGVPKRSQFGFLRIRVRASSLLARQITGWVKGIQDFWG